MLSCRDLCVNYGAQNGTKLRGSGVPNETKLRGSGVSPEGGAPPANGTRPALSGVTLNIVPGEVTGVAGCSGSGKSTLLRCLAGLLAPTSGSCSVDGVSFGDDTDPAQSRQPAVAPRIYRERVGLVSQLPEEQLFARTVREEVGFGPRNLGLESNETEKHVDWALGAVGLDPGVFCDRNPFALSGGEARRVAIADILALRPRYLLLDEPTAGLDPREGRRLLALVTRLAHQGMGVVLVSHDLDALTSCCTQAVLLCRGAVVKEGSAREVLGDAEAVRAAGLAPAVEVELAERLRHRGFAIPSGVLSTDELVAALADGRERP